MIAQKLQGLLDQAGISYHSIPHHTTFHANRTARAADVPTDEFAKSVILRVDGRLCMAVLPASDQVNLDALRRELSAREVELASEAELRQAFPDCDTGAMPPFGGLYGMEVYVSPRLAEDQEIAFNAGSHDEVLSMHYADFERLVNPRTTRM